MYFKPDVATQEGLGWPDVPEAIDERIALPRETVMSSSLRALLAGSVDYAGLFPPARLPLDQAIRNYARYRTDPAAWLLGRFVCPAARLAELACFHEELFRSGRPFRFTALGRAGTTSADFLTGLEADLQDLAACRQRHRGRVVIDVLETRLPADILETPDPDSTRALFAAAAEHIEAKGPPVLTPFYEAGFGADWRATVARVSAALKEDNYSVAAEARTRCRFGGFKLRCGGLDAAAYPTPEQIALVLAACSNSAGEVPIKFTAGLHHPIRRAYADAPAPMHGFVNVLVAGMFRFLRHWPEEQLRQVLEDEQAEHFQFDEEGLAWKEHRLGTEEIAALRQGWITSFGSCSFEEPRDDLKALGLLS